MKLKLIIPAPLLMLLSFSGILTGCGSKAIEIPDHDLNIMIRTALDKPEEPLYAWDLADIKQLKLSMADMLEIVGTKGVIYDLTGLEYCTGLEYLDLTENTVDDLSPLASCTHLTTLLLGKNEIVDISPLASCTVLETLDLSDNQVTDISALAQMSNLRTLYLQKNMINDISALADDDSLETLCIYDNYITDISVIASFTDLKVFLAGEMWNFQTFFQNPYEPGTSNHISDLTPLANCRSLEYLNLNMNEVYDITPLSNLTKLQRLFLSTNYITDISPLESLVDLRELNLSANSFQDIAPLAELKSLEKLNTSMVIPQLNDPDVSILEELLARDIFSITDDTPPPKPNLR